MSSHRFDRKFLDGPECVLQELVVEDDIPEGAPWPEFTEEPQLVSPGSIDPETIQWYSEALAK
jgi:Mn-containing catalase